MLDKEMKNADTGQEVKQTDIGKTKHAQGEVITQLINCIFVSLWEKLATYKNLVSLKCKQNVYSGETQQHSQG